jgi:hypothetical protein
MNPVELYMSVKGKMSELDKPVDPESIEQVEEKEPED